MKNYKIIFLLGLILCVTSCKINITSGFDEIKLNPITRNEAKQILAEKTIDTSYVVFMNKESILATNNRELRPGEGVGFKSDIIKIFDKKGKLIFLFSHCDGKYRKTKADKIFPPKNIKPLPTNWNINDEQALTNDKLPINPNADYIAIFYYSTMFKNKLAFEVKKRMEEMSTHNKNIQFILMNYDGVRD